MSDLIFATEGPCAGHLCDNCRICQRGRCCRNDNPDYKLPGLGEWDGVIYGELGILRDDGGRFECHCCGHWYVSLQCHAWRAHDLTADEYRAIFGLNRNTSLQSPQMRVGVSESIRRRMDQIRDTLAAGRAKRDAATPEQRAEWHSRAYERLEGQRKRGQHPGPRTSSRKQGPLLKEQILFLYRDGVPKRTIARQLGAARSYVRNVIDGASGDSSRPFGSHAIDRQLVDAIFEENARGESQRKLAIKYGIGISTVNKIVHGQHPTQKAAS